MKSLIISIFTALLLVTGIAATTKAATVKDETATVLTGISAISKIEVHGNVELYISDGETDEVKVYNKYYAESALVQSSNGVLRISSYKAEKLVVWVKASDLRSVSAFDNADVKSFGDLSKIEFEVDLHNSATAKLSLDVYSANVTVSDQAKASLSGRADEYSLKYSRPENIDEKDFQSVHTVKKSNTVVSIKKADLDDLAGL